MLIVKRVNDNRLDIEMSGKLDSHGMKAALDDLIEKSEGIEHGRMLFDVIDYRLPSLDAIGIELSRLPSMFRWINRFERAVVLSDRKWLRVISEIEGVMIPGLEIKAFDRDDRFEAEAWLEAQ